MGLEFLEEWAKHPVRIKLLINIFQRRLTYATKIRKECESTPQTTSKCLKFFKKKRLINYTTNKKKKSKEDRIKPLCLTKKGILVVEKILELESLLCHH